MSEWTTHHTGLSMQHKAHLLSGNLKTGMTKRWESQALLPAVAGRCSGLTTAPHSCYNCCCNPLALPVPQPLLWLLWLLLLPLLCIPLLSPQ
jgi:hypothetical protein